MIVQKLGNYKPTFLKRNTMIKALVVRATINNIVKWRVYYAGELLATFENETDAIYYANFIDRQ